MKRCDGSRGVKIIGISAAVADTVRKEAFAAACDDFVPKPVEMQIMISRNVLSRPVSTA
jgi:CheY-like chemotaxis protein